MRHVLSAIVQNVPGVLAHISGMLASRGYNIDSLAVGETEDPHLSRMTFVVVGDDNVLEQVRKQLEKIVTVVAGVRHQLAGLRRARPDADQGQGAAAASRRSEIRELAEIFRGRIVDVGDRGSDRRNLRAGAEGRSVHRADAAVRHRASWCAPAGSPWCAAAEQRRRRPADGRLEHSDSRTVSHRNRLAAVRTP